MTMTPFPLSILSPETRFYEDQVTYLEFPTIDGQYGIAAHHSNLIAPMVDGMIRIRTVDGENQISAVSGGLVKVEQGHVLVMADTIVPIDEIDVQRNEQKAAAAKEALLQKRSIQEYHMAKAQLNRALNRLKVKNHHQS